MTLDVQRALAILGEPTRLRIVELLAEEARTVGEVAAALGALQPQTTKHLQALEAAEIIRIHRLGRRRVARLDRAAMGQLADWFTTLAAADADDAELDRYEDAIRAEATRSEEDTGTRTVHLTRSLAASRIAVWDAWTIPSLARGWWAPRHFSVEAFDLTPDAGTPVRVVLREGDSATYESRGRMDSVDPGRTLVFTLAPVDAAGDPLFAAQHILSLDGDGPVELDLRIEVSNVRAGAEAAVAGLDQGWHQLLDALEASLSE